MKIGIIGSGVVGFATGRGFENFTNEVMFFDVSQERVKMITDGGRKATINIKQLADFSDAFFICVPTPDKNQKIDLSYIKAAIKGLAKVCKDKKDYFVLVPKSTIVPMTTEKMIIPLFEKYSGKKAGKDFGVCFNPEFLQEKRAYEDVINPDRIVIGEYDKRSGDILEALYKPFNAPIIRTDIRTSEMVKYANNCFYATKISFFNELHLMCNEVGIDSVAIRKVVQMDKHYGTHPWEHGHAFGGKCLPKDLNAIIGMFKHQHTHNPVLLKAVRKVNERIGN